MALVMRQICTNKRRSMNYADKKSFPIKFVQWKGKKGNLNHLKSYS